MRHSSLIGGLALLIEYRNQIIIFDSGAKPEVLKNNLEVVGISPKSIDKMIISHKHWDHIGSAAWVAKYNPDLEIYLPEIFRNKVENKLLKIAKNVRSIDKFTPINDNLALIISKNLFVTELILKIKNNISHLVTAQETELKI